MRLIQVTDVYGYPILVAAHDLHVRTDDRILIHTRNLDGTLHRSPSHHVGGQVWEGHPIMLHPDNIAAIDWTFDEFNAVEAA